MRAGFLLAVFFIMQVQFERLSAQVLFDCPGPACPVGSFVGDLILKDVADLYENHGPFDPGHTEFILVADFNYIDASGFVWRIPSGTVVAGAALPKSVWSVIGGPWSGKYRKASILLEYLAETRITTSERTYELYLEAMLNSGVEKNTALFLYYAARTGGPVWREDAVNMTVEVDNISEQRIAEMKSEVSRGITVSEINMSTKTRFE